MKVVMISNYYTHHQAPFSERMQKQTGGNFIFIATQDMSEERKNMGWEIELPDFVLSLAEDRNRCQHLIDDADIVIYSCGNAPYETLRSRLKAKKLTFVYSERLYKNRNERRKRLYHYFKFGRMYRPYSSLYLLCAGAYVSGDYASIGCFKNKSFKWGYFTETKQYSNVETLMAMKSNADASDGLKYRQDVSILWVARLIGGKHPEQAVQLAERLNAEGIGFTMNIIGNGAMEDEIRKMIEDENLQDKVNMLGAMTPDEVRTHMEKSDIFLFTSDHNEGWGAVLNESMNSGCAVVANREIGSVPFMIQDDVNGLSYNASANDLYEKVSTLIKDVSRIKLLGRGAYQTILGSWNPDEAADRFIKLSEHLTAKRKGSPFENGICSIAEIIK